MRLIRAFGNPVTVAFALTPIIAWIDIGQSVTTVNVVVENDDPENPVTVNVTISERGKPDEPYSGTVPPGEQRSWTIQNAMCTKVQVEGHTNTPGTTAIVDVLIKGTNVN